MKEVRVDGVLVEGVVVIDETFHRVSQKFVACNEALKRSAWGITEPRRICFRCFPLEADRAPLVEIIEERAQGVLFKG